MKRIEERPDVRFWTTYDHYMFERETRALRRKHVRALVRAWVRIVRTRVLQELKNAGAQPIKPQRTPA